MNIKRFLKNAFLPYEKNPGWNLDACITIIGMGVWAIVAIGEAYGLAVMSPMINNVGSMLFGAGIRGALGNQKVAT